MHTNTHTFDYYEHYEQDDVKYVVSGSFDQECLEEVNQFGSSWWVSHDGELVRA